MSEDGGRLFSLYDVFKRRAEKKIDSEFDKALAPFLDLLESYNIQELDVKYINSAKDIISNPRHYYNVFEDIRQHIRSQCLAIQVKKEVLDFVQKVENAKQ